MPIDPVCETEVDESTPFKEDVEGRTIYFCSEECMDEYEENVEVYDEPAPRIPKEED